MNADILLRSSYLIVTVCLDYLYTIEYANSYYQACYGLELIYSREQ